ncbi:hypothetical protein BDY19DRAFT_901480 [Irpex rosettiformis]|uniref:Uncharacterized protein n=1 Tax=Irpex rosettiformis TaxID=378272 RepID=A0ACB8UIP1_9APHY|nr:hypothetical protein BDY19DRAFT_901480 [Irpex rosettiformis]
MQLGQLLVMICVMIYNLPTPYLSLGAEYPVYGCRYLILKDVPTDLWLASNNMSTTAEPLLLVEQQESKWYSILNEEESAALLMWVTSNMNSIAAANRGHSVLTPTVTIKSVKTQETEEIIRPDSIQILGRLMDSTFAPDVRNTFSMTSPPDTQEIVQPDLSKFLPSSSEGICS